MAVYHVYRSRIISLSIVTILVKLYQHLIYRHIASLKTKKFGVKFAIDIVVYNCRVTPVVTYNKITCLCSFVNFSRLLILVEKTCFTSKMCLWYFLADVMLNTLFFVFLLKVDLKLITSKFHLNIMLGIWRDVMRRRRYTVLRHCKHVIVTLARRH